VTNDEISHNIGIGHVGRPYGHGGPVGSRNVTASRHARNQVMPEEQLICDDPADFAASTEQYDVYANLLIAPR